MSKALTSRYAPAVGASLALFGLGICPQNQLRLTAAIWMATRSLEFLFNAIDEKGWLENRPAWFGSWLLMPLSCAQLFHAFIFDREATPKVCYSIYKKGHWICILIEHSGSEMLSSDSLQVTSPIALKVCLRSFLGQERRTWLIRSQLSPICAGRTFILVTYTWYMIASFLIFQSAHSSHRYCILETLIPCQQLSSLFHQLLGLLIRLFQAYLAHCSIQAAPAVVRPSCTTFSSQSLVWPDL